MDIGGGEIGSIQLNAEQNDGEPEDVNISDVLEAINLAEYGDVGVVVDGVAVDGVAVDGVAVDGAVADAMARVPPMPTVEIVEQPAPKALRFRYECEGRSAGSIPGINNTPENKTYPTIRINDYIGPVTIVVSCVCKDDPFRPHPHNLVGRERCEKGVCTVKTKITEENRDYQFKNLGIQCVKRRDIADALQARAQLRVDPFRTGFEHRNNPQSIDLNAVRLAFQVFVPDRDGLMRQPLRPVCSDVIFDKKAMCDLQIMRASHCSGSVRGGTQIILLCEKVTREEIAVVFFHEESRWEQAANTLLVHKQVAVAFETPPFADPHTAEHVNVRFQLKRLTDGQRSNSLPFEYIPDYPGTARKRAPHLASLALLLAQPREPVTSTTDSPNDTTPLTTESPACPSSPTSAASPDTVDVEMLDHNEKSLDELLDQVAELDEIYSENRTRLENVTNSVEDADEDFNDAGTYTSLQLAFRNPVDIAEPERAPYEDVQVHSFRGPIIEFTHLKPDSDEAPPLPPKRVRKTSNSFKSSQTSVDSVLRPGKQLPVTRNPDLLKQDKVISSAKSEPALPPAKKRSFFSRIFRRKDRSPAPSVKSEGKKEAKTKPVGRSVSSVSGVRPSKFKSSVSHASLKDNASTAGMSYADSITRISLHGDDNEKSTSQNSLRRPASLHPIPPMDGGTILVAESVLALDANAFKKLQDDLELTDAENYALYMTLAPHATVSEFDETSCYYSPIDGSKFQN